MRNPGEIRSHAGDLLSVAVAACDRAPDLAAIVFEDGATISRSELRDAVERFAGHLAARIAPGDRVAIALENRIEFMIAWLAVVAARGVLVSLNPACGPHDATHVLRDAAAVVAIVSERSRKTIGAVANECRSLREVISLDDPEPHGLAAFDDGPRIDLARRRPEPDAVTNVYYTSGTTGLPKGCELGHSYWLRFLGLWQRLYGIGPVDRILGCVPFFYGDAPWQFLTSLHADSTWVAMRRFSVTRFWDTVCEHRVTQLFTLASMPVLLLRAPPSSHERDHRVRFAVHIGISKGLHREMNERWGFPWVEGYGLTESGLVVAVPLARAAELTGSGSIGIPCPEVTVRLTDDDGGDVATGESGELIVRAPGMMRGYLNRPEATAATLRDGWLHSGDLARADDDGLLYFMGRKKDIIRRNGENVSAAEVEEVLRAHPWVVDAAVVAEPDALRGEEIRAYVQPAGSVNETELPGQLVGFCAERLARHKVPRFIQLRSEALPRTPSMRVDKIALRAGGDAAAAVGWDRERELGW